MDKTKETKELKPEEIEQAAGGNIIQDIKGFPCKFVGHDYQEAMSLESRDGKREYMRYKCTRCGAEIFSVRDKSTNRGRQCTKEEFYNAR